MSQTSLSCLRQFCTFALWSVALTSGGLTPLASALSETSQPAAADWERYATPKADKIVIYKSQRRMELLRGTVVVRSYHVALGHHPFGPKVEAGDGRTPEGAYYIDRRNIASDYHLALHISYPQANDIARAAARGAEPGGAIMIHGQPNDLTPAERKLLSTDWTAGCIALTNPEIDEVWRLVDDGVTVEIEP
jgi:murein L,D-transpeptidase YafK